MRSNSKLYFTQNNCKIKLKCPECIRTKKAHRHCKIFKKMPALWRHIKTEHQQISNLDFDISDIINVLNNLDCAIRWNMLVQYERK